LIGSGGMFIFRSGLKTKRANSRASLGTNTLKKICEGVFCISIYNRRIFTRGFVGQEAWQARQQTASAYAWLVPGPLAPPSSDRSRPCKTKALPSHKLFALKSKLNSEVRSIHHAHARMYNLCRIVAPMQKNQTCVSIWVDHEAHCACYNWW